MRKKKKRKRERKKKKRKKNVPRSPSHFGDAFRACLRRRFDHIRGKGPVGTLHRISHIGKNTLSVGFISTASKMKEKKNVMEIVKKNVEKKM